MLTKYRVSNYEDRLHGVLLEIGDGQLCLDAMLKDEFRPVFQEKIKQIRLVLSEAKNAVTSVNSELRGLYNSLEEFGDGF